MAEALFQARKAKHFLLERQRYAQKINQPAHPVFTSVDEYTGFVLKQSGLEILPQDKKVFHTLTAYFFGVRNQYTEELDFQKSIMLFGNTGVGKSTMIKAFCNNPRIPFLYADTLEVVNEYEKDGPHAIDDYTLLIDNPNRLQKYFGHAKLGMVFDDLGTENTGINFGKKKNVMGEILLLRYANCPGPYTHVTTNNTTDEFLEMYGVRVYDRMREMYNIVEWPADAESRRK